MEHLLRNPAGQRDPRRPLATALRRGVGWSAGRWPDEPETAAGLPAQVLLRVHELKIGAAGDHRDALVVLREQDVAHPLGQDDGAAVASIALRSTRLMSRNGSEPQRQIPASTYPRRGSRGCRTGVETAPTARGSAPPRPACATGRVEDLETVATDEPGREQGAPPDVQDVAGATAGCGSGSHATRCRARPSRPAVGAGAHA